ncbi:protein Z-dependent protease inhibitor [Gastrophryne carolinensis]
MISPSCLKACAEQLAPVLTEMFNRSLEESRLPVCLRTLSIVPIPKKSPTKDLNDYRALTLIVMKVFERLMLSHRTQVFGHFCPMMRPLVFIGLLGLCLAFHPTKDKPKKEKHHQEKIPHSDLHPFNKTEKLSAFDVSSMNSNFGFSLYRKMADKHDNNIFFSPLSVSLLLGSLMLGTRGDTYDQLLSGLHWNSFGKDRRRTALPSLLKDIKVGILKSDGYSLDLGSLSFVHEQFNLTQDFLNQTVTYFDMAYETIDFHEQQAIHYIRDLIREKTRGRISELQDNIDPQTKLLLLDFIFFKGKWQVPFKPESTNTDTFFINKYTSVRVPMMYKHEKVASMFDKSLSCTVLKLPYRGGAHMLVVMPEKEGDFDALEDGLSSNTVAAWLDKMKTRKTDIFLPKFQLDQKYKLKTSLEELGIKDIFTGRANFTGMTEDRNLLLSEVTQRAAIEVDEFGTEATAVTGAEIIAYSLPHTIRINHPFLFMIFDEKFKALLFIGRVTNPTKQ